MLCLQSRKTCKRILVEILPEIIETVEQAIARTKPCASESEQE